MNVGCGFRVKPYIAAMQPQTLRLALESSADPARAEAGLARLRETAAARLVKKPSAEQARLLVALLAGSQTAGELLAAHPEWLGPLLEPGALLHPRREQGLRREVEQWLKPCLAREETEPAFVQLREFKQREMLRIAARDLARLGGALEITREISDVADVCLDAVLRLCLPPLHAPAGAAVSFDCGRALAGHAVLRPRPGQTGRAGTELQFRRGRHVCL